jgi:hypothetical protein
MGQWRRFTVITWSDSNCNARALAETPNADSGRLAVVSAARAAARRSSGSVATHRQLARIGMSEWLGVDARASTATSARAPG